MRRAGRRASGPSARRHLLLAGGGHAHVHVLRMLGAQPLDDVHVTLVSPEPLVVYSGMVPGILVGLYGRDEGRIDVAALAARAGAAYLRDRIVGIDPAARTVQAERSGALPYDVLSLDVGSQPRDVATVAGLPHVVPVKPIEEASARIADFVERACRAQAAPHVAVVGGGAGGIEVAFGLRARLASLPDARVTVLEAAAPLPGATEKVRLRVERLLARYGIDLVSGAGDVRPSERGVCYGTGAARTELAAALVVWATGAEGLPLARESGLAVDPRGFLWVDAHLRTVDRPEILAAGDCALQRGHPDTPRAGVFAVRQGPVLERNLRAALSGGRLRPYVPQRRFLSILSTGDGRAIALRGGWAAHGRLAWRLKDWIDRRFIARYAPPRPEALHAPPSGAAAAMEPCGGCAAKLDATALGGLLGDLGGSPAEGIPIGLEARDDAAVLAAPRDEDLVFTVDAFPAFCGDPFAVGEIAAVNAMSDVYAMGGVPLGALALISADGAGAGAERGAAMRGVAAALARDGAALLGGHTLATGPLSVGLAVLGRVAKGAALRKAGGRAGDVLVLTKPLGTGVVFAAARAGECPAAWTEQALARMRESNARAARVLAAGGAHACTDVSGFGLLGHLAEVLAASRCGAHVLLGRLPALPGARELLGLGWRSSAHDANARAARAVLPTPTTARTAVDVALACDPQTSGGLLAAVPPAQLASVLEELARDGVGAWVVGALEAEEGVRLRAATEGV